MTREDAILIAAGIAAFASVVGLFVNTWSAFFTERRTAYRSSLQESFLELGQVLYEVMALSAKMRKSKSDQAFASARDEANKAAEKADKIRIKLMYALWGIEDGIKQIVWVSTCVALLKNHRDGERAKGIIKRGTNLRRALDNSVRHAYLSGRPPGIMDRAIVKWKSKKLRVYCQNSNQEST